MTRKRAINNVLRPTVAGLAAVLLLGCQSTGSSVTVSYYAVNGQSLDAIDREIRKKGPRISRSRHAVAVARIRMKPKMRFARSDDGCRVAQAKVSVDARVTLPAWTGRDVPNRSLSQAWVNIDRYTRQHEATHVAIAFNHARRMEQALLTEVSARNCAAARKSAARIMRGGLAAHDAAQRQFDANEKRRIAMNARRESQP